MIVAQSSAFRPLQPGQRLDAPGLNGVDKALVVLFVLVGVRDGKSRDRPVEVIPAAKVTGNLRGPPGAGMSARECPAAQPCVIGKLRRVHRRNIHTALHVAKLPHIVVFADGAVRGDAGSPAEERITCRLGEPLAGDDPLALVRVLARARIRGEH